MSPAFALLNASVSVFADTAPPESLFDLVPRIAPRPLLFIYAPDGGNATEVLTPDFARFAGPDASLWTVPKRPAHQGDRDRTGGVRAACRRLLRQGAAQALTDEVKVTPKSWIGVATVEQRAGAFRQYGRGGDDRICR